MFFALLRSVLNGSPPDIQHPITYCITLGLTLFSPSLVHPVRRRVCDEIGGISSGSRFSSSASLLSFLDLIYWQFLNLLCFHILHTAYPIENNQNSCPKHTPASKASAKKLLFVLPQHGSYDCSSNQPTPLNLLDYIHALTVQT